MGVEIQGSYTGNLKVRLEHGPSGAVIHTAAPLDNNGDGSSFSPTDLVAAALASCMVTILAIVGEREGIPLGGLAFRVEKHMQSDPRRTGALPVTLQMPPGLSPGQRRTLEQAALGCPVCRSLLPELERSVDFSYPD